MCAQASYKIEREGESNKYYFFSFFSFMISFCLASGVCVCVCVLACYSNSSYLLFPFHGVDNFRLFESTSPIDRVIGRLPRLPDLGGTQQIQPGHVESEGGREAGDRGLDPAGDRPEQVVGVEQRAQGQGVQVNRIDEVREETALDAKNIPAS